MILQSFFNVREIYIRFLFSFKALFYSLSAQWAWVEVIEQFSFLLVFYVVVWGMRVVKLQASVIKKLITVLAKSEMCHCETFKYAISNVVMEFLCSQSFRKVHHSMPY